MRDQPEQRVEVYAQADRGLMRVEAEPERRLNCLDFIDIYEGAPPSARLEDRSQALETSRRGEWSVGDL